MYKVNGDTIPVVSSYKCLGCIIDEYLVLIKEDGTRKGRGWEESSASLISEVSDGDWRCDGWYI